MSKNNRILIVDDDETNLRYLGEVFGEKFELMSLTSGESALKEVRRFDPAVILLDIMLPGISGYEVCKKIKSDPELSHVKIILISAKAMDDEKKKGYEAGADFYITKPFSHHDLMVEIDSYIS